MYSETSMHLERRLSDPDRWNEQYGDYLLRYALRQVRDRHVAQDLVQETWLAAWQARVRFAGESSERTWLTGILRHKVIDHMRSAGRERLLPDRQDRQIDSDSCTVIATWPASGPAPWMDPARQLERKQLRTALDGCLCGLTNLMRQVFALCDLEESLPRDVAKRLGVTEGHLYVVLHRARKRIKQCLTGHGSDGYPLASTAPDKSH